jgi:hypothetical protein
LIFPPGSPGQYTITLSGVRGAGVTLYALYQSNYGVNVIDVASDVGPDMLQHHHGVWRHRLAHDTLPQCGVDLGAKALIADCVSGMGRAPNSF